MANAEPFPEPADRDFVTLDRDEVSRGKKLFESNIEWLVEQIRLMNWISPTIGRRVGTEEIVKVGPPPWAPSTTGEKWTKTDTLHVYREVLDRFKWKVSVKEVHTAIELLSIDNIFKPHLNWLERETDIAGTAYEEAVAMYEAVRRGKYKSKDTGLPGAWISPVENSSALAHVYNSAKM